MYTKEDEDWQNILYVSAGPVEDETRDSRER